MSYCKYKKKECGDWNSSYLGGCCVTQPENCKELTKDELNTIKGWISQGIEDYLQWCGDCKHLWHIAGSQYFCRKYWKLLDCYDGPLVARKCWFGKTSKGDA